MYVKITVYPIDEEHKNMSYLYEFDNIRYFSESCSKDEFNDLAQMCKTIIGYFNNNNPRKIVIIGKQKEDYSDNYKELFIFNSDVYIMNNNGDTIDRIN